MEGECGPSKGSGPSFEYGEGFSIDEIEISTEFDTDLEIVYTMPDGKECKQRSPCKKGGSAVKNTQCGGAKKVVFVHPTQPDRAEKCKIKIPKIRFNCGSAKPPKSTGPSETPDSPSYTESLPESSGTADIPNTTASVPETTDSPGESDTTVDSSSPEKTNTEGSTATPPEETTPGGPRYTEGTPSDSTSIPEESTPGQPDEPSYTEGKPPGSTSAPEGSGSTIESSSPEESTPSSPEESTPVPSEPIIETEVTSHMTTSTIFTTTTSTVTSCAPEITGCPEGEDGSAVVTLTIPVTTTVCPVTETITRTHEPGQSTTEDSSPETPETSEAPENSDVQKTTEDSTVATTATRVTDQPTDSGPGPKETLPCPEVVPSCLNTWLFELDCPDNTDTSCFCPSAAFVENVFTCIYAHGDSDSVISEAIHYFQGICAGHASENPGIITGINSITPIITPTGGAQSTVPGDYTTITISVTTEVPCVTDGVTLTDSSTKSVIEQTAEVPNVGFQTNSAGEVGVVPSTPAPVVVSSTAPSTLIPQPSETGDDASSPGFTEPPQAGAKGVVVSLLGIGTAFLGVFVFI